jgi:hypothetical protein
MAWTNEENQRVARFEAKQDQVMQDVAYIKARIDGIQMPSECAQHTGEIREHTAEIGKNKGRIELLSTKVSGTIVACTILALAILVLGIYIFTGEIHLPT